MRARAQYALGAIGLLSLGLGLGGSILPTEWRPYLVGIGAVLFAVAVLLTAQERIAQNRVETKGPHSPAVAGSVGGGVMQGVRINATGPVTINNGVVPVEPKETVEEKQRDALTLEAPARQQFSRAQVLVRLAILRTEGVERRNALISPTTTAAQARREWDGWLERACDWVRRIPEHGGHEERAFRTLDTFSMEAAPAGSYANPQVQWEIAGFSTHIQRLEDLRRRYSRPD